MTQGPSANKKPQVVVIGGGITGLACTQRLLELSPIKKIPIRILLLEGSRKLGGVISTVQKQDCVLEAGPDSLFTEKSWGVDFCKRIGLEDDIIGTNPEFQKSFIARKDKLIPVPEGFAMIAPARLWPLFVSPLFSLKGKLRASCDLLIPRKRDGEDESLYSFVVRRLGKEVHDRIAQPMVGGVYSSDTNDLSIQATFPRFLELEKKYGSVIRGLLAGRKNTDRGRSARGPRYSLFATLKNGMGKLVDQVTDGLPDGIVRLESQVKRIRKDSADGKSFRIEGDDFTVHADAVCAAAPARQSARFLETLDRDLSGGLGQIPYRSGATVNFVYDRKQINRSLDGFGFVVPESEKRFISGCTFSSVKFSGRAPEGRVVLRAFAGERSEGELTSLSDQEIERKAKRDLEEIVGVLGAPQHSMVSRYPRSLPQYRVGHLKLIEKIRDRCHRTQGLALAGNYFYGVGIPDCIRSGELAAEKILNDLE